jgi:hypothetical protein
MDFEKYALELLKDLNNEMDLNADTVVVPSDTSNKESGTEDDENSSSWSIFQSAAERSSLGSVSKSEGFFNGCFSMNQSRLDDDKPMRKMISLWSTMGQRNIGYGQQSSEENQVEWNSNQQCWPQLTIDTSFIRVSS